MEPISSTDNHHIKLARSLREGKGRKLHRAFLAEGLRLVEAAADAATPQLVLHTPEFEASGDRARALLRRLDRTGVLVRPVTERVFSHVADTQTPQGIAAVVPLLEREHPRRLTARLDLILDRVGDPGNAGTLLRTAAAAGVGRVVAAPGTVDLYSPKVVRAAAGAHFGLALAAPRAWDEVGGTLEPGAPVYLADARADRRYWDVDWTASSSLIVSSEAHGASDAARRLATQTIGIPMAGGVESLNAGVAGSIILYEAARQRALAGVTQ